jgi:hypothetical protein
MLSPTGDQVVDLSLVKPLAILRRKGLDFRGFIFFSRSEIHTEKVEGIQSA